MARKIPVSGEITDKQREEAIRDSLRSIIAACHIISRHIDELSPDVRRGYALLIGGFYPKMELEGVNGEMHTSDAVAITIGHHIINQGLYAKLGEELRKQLEIQNNPFMELMLETLRKGTDGKQG